MNVSNWPHKGTSSCYPSYYIIWGCIIHLLSIHPLVESYILHSLFPLWCYIEHPTYPTYPTHSQLLLSTSSSRFGHHQHPIMYAPTVSRDRKKIETDRQTIRDRETNNQTY